MAVRCFLFGDLDGQPVHGFVLDNQNGLEARLIAYGACLIGMRIPDRHGRFADVVLGFDDLSGYRRHRSYFGATCGRFSNRIAAGAFHLDGETYRLARNENDANHLHGGICGFDRRLWNALADAETNSVQFSLISPDGDEGYPGLLTATATYQLTQAGELKIHMTAVTDRPTVVNMVHHSYWNLCGHDSGTCLNHRLWMDAGHYLPVDDALIPIGVVSSVAGTPFDFRQPKLIGAGIDALSGGFDHNWCLSGGGGHLRPVARLVDSVSGRGLEIETNQPGLQFYASGALGSDGPLGKGGVGYASYQAAVLETQGFPNAPNVGHFPSARLAPGGLYDHRMNIRFFAA